MTVSCSYANGAVSLWYANKKSQDAVRGGAVTTVPLNQSIIKCLHVVVIRVLLAKGAVLT